MKPGVRSDRSASERRDFTVRSETRRGLGDARSLPPKARLINTAECVIRALREHADQGVFGDPAVAAEVARSVVSASKMLAGRVILAERVELGRHLENTR